MAKYKYDIRPDQVTTQDAHALRAQAAHATVPGEAERMRDMANEVMHALRDQNRTR